MANNKSNPAEFEVEIRTYNPPGLFDDFIPGVVSATFDFIEREQLRPLITSVYRMDLDAIVKIVEHRAPGQERLIFEGDAAECLIDILQGGMVGTDGEA